MDGVQQKAEQSANPNDTDDTNQAEMIGKSGAADGDVGKRLDQLSKKTKRADFESN